MNSSEENKICWKTTDEMCSYEHHSMEEPAILYGTSLPALRRVFANGDRLGGAFMVDVVESAEKA